MIGTCIYYILDVIKCMYYSKNSEIKVTLLLVNIFVNTECQHKRYIRDNIHDSRRAQIKVRVRKP